jgi:GDP-L-fucose synthase
VEKKSKIFVAGHRGLVGSALIRVLNQNGYKNLIVKTRTELDLTNASHVNDFFKINRPDYVFMAAAKVGGIWANSNYPVDFIRDNILIQSHTLEAACFNGVKKLVFLGSSCVYPSHCSQPIKEDYLMTGPLEPTNEWYAIAKIAGIKMCQAYQKQYGFKSISLMPNNLYGPNDNFDVQSAHVIPALLRRFHEAKISNKKELVIWGTGNPRREFLHVDDVAEACLFLMNNYDGPSVINIGTGQDMQISDLVCLIKEVVGYEGKIIYDSTRPDGCPQKLLDISKINQMGWQYRITLKEGLISTYKWFVENYQNGSNNDSHKFSEKSLK